MSALFSYSLTVSLVVILIFPVLHQIVNRCTSFRFNRIVLLTGMILSLALPFILDGYIALFQNIASVTISSGQPIPAHSPAPIAAQTVEAPMLGESPIIPSLIIIYLTGIALLLLREIFSFCRLFLLIAECDKIRREGVTIRLLTNPKMAPFSWGNFIFLHEAEFKSNDCGIFLHEKAHTLKRHWIDVLFADLFCILLWFNPFAWLTRQLMRLNHEFEADETAINSGMDPFSYQQLLVTKAIGMKTIPITNSFSLNSRGFRKRVLIIGRKHTSKKSRLIALCAIPAFAIAIFLLSTPLSAQLLGSISNYSFVQTPPTPKDNPTVTPKVKESEPASLDSGVVKADALIVLPTPIKDQTALANIIKTSLSAVELDKETRINIGIVINEEGKVTEVVTDRTDDPVIKAIVDQTVSGLKFEEIKLNGKPIQTKFNIPVVIQKKS